MARRMTKKQSEGIFYLIIFLLILGAIAKFFETVGFIVPTIIICVGAALYIYIQNKNKVERKASLLKKYGDEDLVIKLIEGHIWQDQTAEQVIDSIGKPIDIDQKVLKTKKKEIWKYGHQGGNRYTLRVTLDNDLVVGWDQKA